VCEPAAGAQRVLVLVCGQRSAARGQHVRRYYCALARPHIVPAGRVRAFVRVGRACEYRREHPGSPEGVTATVDYRGSTGRRTQAHDQSKERKGRRRRRTSEAKQEGSDGATAATALDLPSEPALSFGMLPSPPNIVRNSSGSASLTFCAVLRQQRECTRGRLRRVGRVRVGGALQVGVAPRGRSLDDSLEGRLAHQRAAHVRVEPDKDGWPAERCSLAFSFQARTG
jgi:hypothetical protein